MRYVVIVEKGPTSWGAHVPDLPGCVAVAESREEVLCLIKESVAFHIEGLRKAGQAIPRPHSEAAVIEISAA